MPQEIKVLVADDHPIFRHGLVALIENDENLHIVGEAENGKIALDIAKQEKPDVIILDIDMPEMNGIETAQELLKNSSSAKVIFLTMHKDNMILKSLKSLNVKGYVIKDSAINEIIHCIKTVCAGKTYLSPALNELILEGFDNDTQDLEILPIILTLSKSEKQVLSLITESKTTKEIADKLYVSVRTVESHRYNICSKLNLNGTHALFKFAVKNKDKILKLISKPQ